MNELERTALNEILRTVTYIAEKLDELDARFSQSKELKMNELISSNNGKIWGVEMDEITIREDEISLNGQELKTLTGFEIKSTTENGYAEVKLTLLAKLAWERR